MGQLAVIWKGSEPTVVSFHKLTNDQTTEFHQILASAGFSKEDVEAVLANPAIADEMLYSLRLVLRTRVIRIGVLSRTVHPSHFAHLFNPANVERVVPDPEDRTVLDRRNELSMNYKL